jgi:putative ABC transport system permease protein
MMETLVQDVRFAVRSLVRQPAFALTTIVTLALGIGAATAIFSVYNAIILRPLPFERPEQVVAVTSYWTERGRRGLNVSGPDFHDWKTESRSFAALARYSGAETSVVTRGAAEYAAAYAVTSDFFEALGLRAAAGRRLTDEDHQPDSPLAAVITDAYWNRQFGRSPSALGATLRMHDRVFTIAGILEPGARYPARADVYYPAWIWPETPSRSAHNYRAVGRLADGVTVEQAHAEIAAIATRLRDQYPDDNAGKLAAVVPLKEIVVGDTRPMLLVLMAAVGLLLVIACANVANLLLVRAAGRAREMQVRAAVGAGRSRLMRQMLTESAVIGLAGAAAGVWLARLGVLALVALAPADLPRAADISIDATALGFGLLAALGASLLFGLAPALQVSGFGPTGVLHGGGKGTGVGARTGWARSAFVVVQVALALLLVVGAGLLGRSLSRLGAVDVGLRPDRLLVLRTSVPVASLEEAPRATAFYRELLADLRTVPGVESAAAVTSLPTAVRSNGAYWLEGGPGPDTPGHRPPQAVFTVATPGYLATAGIPLLNGRDFSDRDRPDAELVAIVSESLARHAFGAGDPIGRRIKCGLDAPAFTNFMTIVGVVADVRTYGPALPPQPELYMPYEQHPGPASAMNVIVRTEASDPLALAGTLHRRVQAANPDVPVRAATMEATLGLASATPRFRTSLLVVFAAVALLLALAGVYGVMAYSVSQRVPELGIRIALGATPITILRLVVGQGARLAALGLAAGTALALALGPRMEDLLFGVTARDPLTLALVAASVAAASLAACYLPARRAVGVDPMVALRSE